MGKGKNKTKRLDFDARHVRTKQTVMGRRVQAQETAAGQKRGTAARDNRSSTLLIELQKQHRNPANVLNDRRGSGALPTNKEKMLARWHREKQAMFKQKQRNKKYSLGEDEGDGEAGDPYAFTHMGRTLGERSEDFTDMPENYEENHGGDAVDDDREVNYADLLAKGVDSVIARSKIYKAEKAKEKEAQRALGADLDDQWTENLALVMANKRSRDDDYDYDTIRTEAVTRQASDGATAGGDENKKDEDEDDDFDDFDSLVKVLGTEAKGAATDRMKRPEELAEERVAALEALELERLRRQRGEEGAAGDDAGNDANVRLVHSSAATALMTSKMGSNMTSSDSQEFKFPVPASGEEWARMSAEWSPREKELVVRRIMACNHPSMGDGNRERLEKFLAVLVAELAAAPARACAREAVDSAAAAVLFLARELGGEAAAAAFLPRIRECYDACVAAQKWPSYGEICMLKLCADVFPASDFRHPVTTPALILICACVARAGKGVLDTIEEGRDRPAAVSALFMCSLALHYVSQSKRFVPEVFAFVESLVQRLSTLCISDISVASSGEEEPEGADAVLEPLPDPSHMDEIERMPGAKFDRALLLTSVNVFARLTKVWLVNNRRNKFMYKIFDRFVEETLEPLIANYAHIAALRTAAEGLRDTIAAEIGAGSDAQEAAEGDAEASPASKFPAFRTVERKNPLPAKEFTPRVVEQKALQQRARSSDPSDPAAYREKVKKLKRAVARERKAVTREIRKDSAYVTEQLDREARRENAEIRERTGRIMNMLQDQQHQEKVDMRLKERAHKKLRL